MAGKLSNKKEKGSACPPAPREKKKKKEEKRKKKKEKKRKEKKKNTFCHKVNTDMVAVEHFSTLNRSSELEEHVDEHEEQTGRVAVGEARRAPLVDDHDAEVA